MTSLQEESKSGQISKSGKEMKSNNSILNLKVSAGFLDPNQDQKVKKAE